MSKFIKGHHVGTATINSGKSHYIMSSMLSYLPEHVIYVERNTSARVHIKLKLYVTGRRSTSYTTFEARPWGNTNGHDYNHANSVSGRITYPNAVNCHVILQATRITLRYVETRFHNDRYLA
ncbi:hypothetical protein HanRHA438_Chr16g0755641 [Helianthus annuus]|nr:hypothetical protein HanHA300_Chr16g0606571 [Helianthus annuus]KAJ0442373.1 hypothetical protein HanIR_Chr16g0808481 [Helianthus annuus]KAJ0460140.1 hypothetical protein HanHA89_Chr16g0657151 [Helianthus annuus]KAJ0640582.1 hypothetical protein HanLR1_Chr16g0617171 [Helianthus annuus]KAJ0644511.1 hypothetical protein HanOQP8_Chr16g0612971 [Helianthus annuus]